MIETLMVIALTGCERYAENELYLRPGSSPQPDDQGRCSATEIPELPQSETKLPVTPRVYLARKMPDAGGLSETRGWGSASATIPAKGQVGCGLEKLPEALEGPYEFHMKTSFQ